MLRWLTGQSGGTPGSLVNFSGVALRKLESGQFARAAAWGSEKSSCAHSYMLQTFVEFPNSFLLYVYVELYAPERIATRQTS
jgi:hypothetical protein